MARKSAKQRGKTDKADAATVVEEERKNETLEDQLNRADAAVQKARDTTAYLQDQWRTHLYRISFLVLLVAFNQCRLPMNACMQNIKLANTLTAEANPERNISGMQAFWLLLMDAFGEICGNLMVIFLIAFLSMKPPGTFASPFYLMATLFLPFQLTAFFSVKEIGCKHVLDGMQDVEETKTRDFPVGVVFHAIVTGCYFFMESQMAGRERDVLAIQKLRNDLKEAQARGLVDKDGNKKSK